MGSEDGLPKPDLSLSLFEDLSLLLVKASTTTSGLSTQKTFCSRTTSLLDHYSSDFSLADSLNSVFSPDRPRDCLISVDGRVPPSLLSTSSLPIGTLLSPTGSTRKDDTEDVGSSVSRTF